MRKIIEWIVAIVGLGGFLLTRANWIANHFSFLSLPNDLEEALIAMSHIPILVTCGLLIVGVAGIIFLVHDYVRHWDNWAFPKSLMQPKSFTMAHTFQLEETLHVGTISVGFDKMETEHWMEIDITAHNGSAANLQIGNDIMGHIELRPMASLPRWMDSPTLLPNTTKDIRHGSEFLVILKQEIPQDASHAAMVALDRGIKIQLNCNCSRPDVCR